MRVDGHPAVPDESTERDRGGLREVDGERAGGRDAGDHRDAGGGGLLDDLEAGAAADDEELRGGARDAPVEDQLADRLVERVVAADVLEGGDDLSAGVEDRGGVDAAGPGEVRLKPLQ